MGVYHLEIVSERPYALGPNHTPYMVLRRPDGFSCAHCAALRPQDDGTFNCISAEYQAFTGGPLLKDASGQPLKDPRLACSDWFTPKEV